MGTASKNAWNILNQIGLSTAFDSVVDGNRVANAKSDPEVFLLAAAELNLKPGECLVFEDAVAGIEAAHRGGMKCIGVGYPQALQKADRVIPGFINTDLKMIEF